MYRRTFLRTSVAGLAAASLGLAPPKPHLKKAVKFGMVKAGSVLEKFELVKKVGFLGVELDSPMQIDRDEVVRAEKQTGVAVHGVIDSTHWSVRHSDPNPQTRAKALADLEGALRDCKTYGGDTVLLVPGAVRHKDKENFDQVWERSTENVKKALPLAKDLDVKIAIEVVWNDFITTPDELIKYVDQFASPYVGAYFDASNMIKYGVPPADWIRALGKRMLKFDFKGYSKSKKWVPIGEGDEDWPAILKALSDVGYNGWATAEVAGGGEKELRDVFDRMTRVLG